MDCCTVLDLRQYTLYDGRRDDLIQLFDREFVEGQEAYGMHLVGQFRDLDDENRFVWLRGFASLEARAQALQGFYSSPTWKAHAAEANATMKDSDNALLLRPVELGPTWPSHPGPVSGAAGSAGLTGPAGASVGGPRPPVRGGVVPGSVVVGAVHHRPSVDDGFVDFFAARVVPALADAGVALAAVFESLPVANNFPALPLRDEIVLVWFAVFESDTAYQEHQRRLAKSAYWQEISAELDHRCLTQPQQLRLRPTSRSQLR